MGLIQKAKKYNEITFNTYLSIITLNISGFNPPITKYRLVGQIKKNPAIYCLQEIHITQGIALE